MTEEYVADQTTVALYPEAAVGGYTSQDGGLEFYLRVNALVDENSHVLDFGAGRGWWAFEPWAALPKKVRWLRGRVARVVGTDVDPVVAENPTVDEAHVVGLREDLPFAENEFDVVIADYVLEHVDPADVAHVSGEVMRVLKPGGWFAARTPNKWGYIGIVARLVPNRLHVAVLKVVQPGRKVEDVFPTRYAMNTPSAVREAFAGHQVVMYPLPGEPAYFGRNRYVLGFVRIVMKFVPRGLQPTYAIFVRKRG